MKITITKTIMPETTVDVLSLDLMQNPHLSMDDLIDFSGKIGGYWFKNTKAHRARYGGTVRRIIGPNDNERGWLFSESSKGHRDDRRHAVLLFTPDGVVKGHPEFVTGSDSFGYRASSARIAKDLEQLALSYRTYTGGGLGVPAFSLKIDGKYGEAPRFTMQMCGSQMPEPANVGRSLEYTSRIAAQKERAYWAKKFNKTAAKSDLINLDGWDI